VYSSTVVAGGGGKFAPKFYVDTVISDQPFGHQKTRDTGLPDGEDRIPLRSLVLTQYWIMSDRQTDRRTDGRTDGCAVALQASFVRSAVKSKVDVAATGMCTLQ